MFLLCLMFEYIAHMIRLAYRSLILILMILIFKMNKKIHYGNLIACISYAVISILQTLNSRYLFQSLHFDYYSFIFGLQRIVIIITCYLTAKDLKPLNIGLFFKVMPYSIAMYSSNILSSYCITIMPIASFLAFKKFIILFILFLSLVFGLPNRTNRLQLYCIAGIVMGGIFVGERDLLNGNSLGYISCLGYGLADAISLQYSAFLAREEKFSPQQLLMYNAIVSLPYYIGTVLFESQSNQIIAYFKNNSDVVFWISFLVCIIFACISQLAASYIAMKISPFEKATVSNIKDIVLTSISVYYFHDFSITYISGLGLLMCLIGSGIFSAQQLNISNKLKLQRGDQINSQQISFNHQMEDRSMGEPPSDTTFDDRLQTYQENNSPIKIIKH